ncbi:hypothetical protein A8C32_07020 [Flavivirga aquatica]|uniref:DUF4064 domain-containing protein n=1 Tax=Flavivirga aquatica TaxID=1849968 RepID=A0A1E5SIJ4_9FLAO|nr:hypothetical protein [Flavivirga aquatica]OEJ98933.1 hypothetical protein A8C32_07020 [Flavivirga aquatica]
MKPNNLDTFKTLFLVKGILTLAFSLFFIFYAGMGLFFSTIIEASDKLNDAPFNLGIIFVIIGVIGIIICVTLGVLTLIASKYIKHRKNYTFIFVISIINCLTGILGILLGVFSLIELTKPEIKELFNKA